MNDYLSQRSEKNKSDSTASINNKNPKNLMKNIFDENEFKQFFQAVDCLIYTIKMKSEGKLYDKESEIKTKYSKPLYGKLIADFSESNIDRNDIQIEIETEFNQIKNEAKIFLKVKYLLIEIYFTL